MEGPIMKKLTMLGIIGGAMLLTAIESANAQYSGIGFGLFPGYGGYGYGGYGYPAYGGYGYPAYGGYGYPAYGGYGGYGYPAFGFGVYGFSHPFSGYHRPRAYLRYRLSAFGL